MRRQLCPRLVDGYAAWQRADRGRALRKAAHSGVAHWERVCRELLALHAERGAEGEAAIEALSTAAEARF
jgi:hypothetical protein